MNKPSQYLHLTGLAVAVVLASTSAFAQRSVNTPEEEQKTKQTVAMSQQVYEKLSEIQELLEAEDFAGAQSKLDDLKSKGGLSAYETAQAWNLQGYLSYLREDYPGALRAYNQLLAQPEVPEALQLSTLKTMAQLQFITEDYDGSLATVRRLMQVIPEPSADIVMLEGQIYYQMERYTDAIPPLEKAVSMYRNQGQVPKENWLLLLHSCYLQLGDYDKLMGVILELIQHYPKDTYLLTLAGVYSERGETKKQLALTEVLYETGHANPERHATNLANLYLLHNIPFKAAQVLEAEIDRGNVEGNERNLRLLSQAWYTARNDKKAIPPLRRAADLSEDGELYVRLAQSHVNLDQWPEAEDAIQNALRIGGLKRTDQAQLVLGMALLNQKKLDSARNAFERAARDQRSARAASQWVKYVDSEIRRRELMNQDIEYEQKEKDELLRALEEDQASSG